MSAESSPRSRIRVELGAGLAMFALAVVWLSLRAPAIVQKDGSRDLAFARDLLEGAQLHGHGAWSGLSGLVQGTTWISFIALVEGAGLGIAGLEWILTLLLAATVGGGCLAFARLLTDAKVEAKAGAKVEAGRTSATELPERTRTLVAAMIGSALMLALLPFGVEVPILWQPLLLPIPVFLAHLCLWRLLRHGELVDALALGVFASLAFDVHILSAILIWLVLLAVPLGSRRPLLAIVGVAVLGFATNWISSPGMVPDHLIRLNSQGLVGPVVLVLVAPLGLGLALRKPFAKLDWPARLRVALGFELLILSAVVLATELDSTPDFGGRYVLPFLPALGLAAALVASWSRSRSGLVVASVATLAMFVVGYRWLALGGRNELPSNPTWVAADFDRVAARLDARGLTWTETALALQAPRMIGLVSQLASRLEPGPSDPPPPEAGLLLLAYTPEEAERIRAEVGDALVEELEFDDIETLLIETRARSRRGEAEICRDDSQDCMPVIITLTERVRQAHPTAWIDPSRDLTAEAWLMMGEREPPREYLWRVPVGAGPDTILSLPDELPTHCGWSFVAVEGFEAGAPLPARELALAPESEGKLLISRRIEGEGCSSFGMWPPIVFETDPRWVELRASLVSDW